MNERTARRLAYGLAGAVVLVTIGSLALGAAQITFVVVLAVVALTYGVSGAVLASRRPGNPIGWIMVAIGLSESTLVIGAGYVVFTQDHWSSAPFQEIAAWTGNWIWIPGLGAILTFLLLLFPDGHPPSPRWRWVMWVAGAGMVVGTIGSAVGLWSARWLILANPDRTDVSPSGLAGAAGLAGLILLFGVAGIAAIASVVVRWRRAVGDERQQLRWFLVAATVAGVGFFAALPSGSNELLLVAGILLLPVSVAVAVMKYRLYELDVVIRKAVVVLLIAMALTGLSLAVLALPLFAVGGILERGEVALPGRVGHRHIVRAGTQVCPTAGGPRRLRAPSNPVRSAGRLLRAARLDVLRRRRDGSDGAAPARRHRSRRCARVAVHRRTAPRRGIRTGWWRRSRVADRRARGALPR